jgi:hypothetical protein
LASAFGNGKIIVNAREYANGLPKHKKDGIPHYDQEDLALSVRLYAVAATCV